MARINNLKASKLSALATRTRQLAGATPGRNSSVSGGRTRFIGAHSLIIEGSGDVNGTLFIVGVLDGNGNLLWSGPATFTGSTTINGPLFVNGAFAVTSTAVSMSLADVFVKTLTASGLGSFASLQSILNAAVGGTFTNAGHPTTSSPANTVLSAGGLLQRSTSSRRFKIDPVEMEFPDSLLDVPVKWWIDLGEAERLAEILDSPRPWTREQAALYEDVSLRRVPGFIAEEVQAAGGEDFVTFDADGRVEGIMQDRYLAARTAVLARRAEGDRARIDKLERALEKSMKRIDALEKRG